MTVAFVVPGKPAPQGSKRHVGNGRMLESSKDVGAWRERIALVAHNAMTKQAKTVITDAVDVRVAFVLPRPKSTPKKTPAAVKRPDIDKLSRAVLDAITGVVIRDDSQVVNLHAFKRIADVEEAPHAWIVVETAA